MAIDPLAEDTFPLAQAPKRLPQLRNNRPVHVSTLWRWATTGLRGVRLETLMVGGVRVTSAQALRQFFAALSNKRPHGPPAHAAPQNQEVEEELDQFGLR